MSNSLIPISPEQTAGALHWVCVGPVRFLLRLRLGPRRSSCIGLPFATGRVLEHRCSRGWVRFASLARAFPPTPPPLAQARAGLRTERRGGDPVLLPVRPVQSASPYPTQKVELAHPPCSPPPMFPIPRDVLQGLTTIGGTPPKVRCGPATVLQPRLPSHGLHRHLSTLRVGLASIREAGDAPPPPPPRTSEVSNASVKKITFLSDLLVARKCSGRRTGSS